MIFTTFDSNAEYSKRFLETAYLYPVPVLCYTDKKLTGYDNVIWQPIEIIKELVEKYSEHRGLCNGRYDYNRDAAKFIYKMAVIGHHLQHQADRNPVWLDADTYAKKPVPATMLKTNQCAAYLGRQGYHTEGGIYIFNRSHGKFDLFADMWQQVLESDRLFELKYWHDCGLFDYCVDYLGGWYFENLSPAAKRTEHIFVKVFGEYIDHLKGPKRKKRGYS